MSSMTFVVPNLQQRESLGVYHAFGTKEVTFWESLDTESRARSVNSDISRVFFKQKAWDIAGPVLKHWNDVLVHAVQATFKNHRTDILRGRGWDGAIDCWMIGDQTSSAVPKVVLSCIDLATVKRFMKKLVRDKYLRSSGFDLVGRRGCLQHVTGKVQTDGSLVTFEMPHLSFKFSEEYEPDANLRSPLSRKPPRHTRLRRTDKPTVQACGLRTLIRFETESLASTTRAATIGGLVIVDDDFYYLTTAHVFVPNVNDLHGESIEVADVKAQATRKREIEMRADFDDNEDIQMDESFIIKDAVKSEAGLRSGSPLEYNDDQDWKMISWLKNDIDDEEDEHDEISYANYSTSGDETGLLETSSLSSDSTYDPSNEREVFEDALIFATTPWGIESSPAQAIASFKSVGALNNPHADLEKDWALLVPRIEPTSMINQVPIDGKVLQITKFADFGEHTQPLLVRSKSGDAQRVICSRAASLISPLRGNSLALAYKVYERIEPGDSGSWVVDNVSGDLVGIIVAASTVEEHGYMLPSTDVLADMTAKRQTVPGDTTIALPSKDLFSERPNLAHGLLSRAVKLGNYPILGMLLNQSVIDLDIQGSQGDKLLRAARDSGVESIVRLLLDAREGAVEDEGYFDYSLSSGGEANSLPPKVLARRKRASKPKIRSGCTTCKIRRIKCDETKPSCLRCTSTGRSCDGYDSFTGKFAIRPQTVSRAASSLTFSVVTSNGPSSISSMASTQDKRLFHRFQLCTLPALSADTTSALWTEVLAPVAAQERVIYNAIIALSALHEDYQDRAGKHSPLLLEDTNYRSALRRYCGALRLLNTMLNLPSRENAKIAIIASVIFAFFEMLRRNNMAMVVHYQQGMRELIRQISLPAGESLVRLPENRAAQNVVPPRLNQIPRDEVDELLRIFAQFDIAAVKINKERIEPLLTQLSRPPNLQAEGISLRQLRLHLENVVIALYQLTRSDARMYRYLAPDAVPSEWQQQLHEAVGIVDAWSTLLVDFSRSTREEPNTVWTNTELKTFLGLWMHLQISRIELKMTCGCGPETSFDLYKEDFVDVVRQAEGLASSLDLLDAEPLGPETTPFIMTFGIGYPLYFVATRCRDRVLRRKAVALLRKSGKEGLFEGPIMAVLALHLIALEETGVPSDEPIPECNRFHDVKFIIEYDSRQIMFEARRALDTSLKNWGTHRASIPF